MSLAVDIIILIPLAWGGYKGYKKGLIVELVSLLAFVLAIVLGFQLMDFAVGLLQPYLGKDNRLVPLIAFVGVFILVLLLLNLMSRFIKKLMDKSFLGTFDDIAGAILGVLKWAFAFSVLLWLFDKAQVPIPEEYTRDAVLYPYLLVYAPKIIEVAGYILPFTKDLVNSINDLFS